MEEWVNNMTPKDVLQQSMSVYKDSIKTRIKLLGKQILFVDDSQEMLTLIETRLRDKNLLEGYWMMSNPVFAKHTLDWLMSEGVLLSDYIKCAVLDIDFGIYNKDISVNDLVKILVEYNVPVILYSAIQESKWHSYVDSKFHDKVEFISKVDIQAINKIYTVITEKESIAL